MVEYLIVFLAVFTSVIYYSLVDFIEKKIRTNVMLKIIIKTISAFKHPALASTFISFEFMKMIWVDGKSNFFEQRVTEYQRSYMVSKKNERDFVLDENF